MGQTWAKTKKSKSFLWSISSSVLLRHCDVLIMTAKIKINFKFIMSDYVTFKWVTELIQSQQFVYCWDMKNSFLLSSLLIKIDIRFEPRKSKNSSNYSIQLLKINKLLCFDGKNLKFFSKFSTSKKVNKNDNLTTFLAKKWKIDLLCSKYQLI